MRRQLNSQSFPHFREINLTSSLVLFIVGEVNSFATVLTLLNYFYWIEETVSDHLVSVLFALHKLFRDAEPLIHALLVVADVAGLSREFIVVVKLTLQENIDGAWYLQG